MNAITLLTNDHKTVEALLTELADTTSRWVKNRMDLLEQFGLN